MLNKVRASALTTMLGVGLLAIAAVPSMNAGVIDKKVVMTFNAPIAVAGMTLPAGTYVFKPVGDTRFVRVMDRDETHLYAIFQTISAQATTPGDTARVQLAERAANAPEALRAWFYPGDVFGWEIPGAVSGTSAGE